MLLLVVGTLIQRAIQDCAYVTLVEDLHFMSE